MEKLGKAWERLTISQSRQKAGVPWMKWESGEDEAIGEPSATALKENCLIVRVMVKLLHTFDPIPIDRLQKQVL